MPCVVAVDLNIVSYEYIFKFSMENRVLERERELPLLYKMNVDVKFKQVKFLKNRFCTSIIIGLQSLF